MAIFPTRIVPKAILKVILIGKCLTFLVQMSTDQWFTFFPAPLCENCQWRPCGVNVYGDQISKNVKSTNLVSWGLKKKKRKKERKETDKSRKIVQFPRERKTSSITLLAWCSLTQLLTLDFLLIILVLSGKISLKIWLKGPIFYNKHRKHILIQRFSNCNKSNLRRPTF